MAAAEENLYEKEPTAQWHPLTHVHAGGPAWRWPEKKRLKGPSQSERRDYQPHLPAADLLPQFLQTLVASSNQLKVKYK